MKRTLFVVVLVLAFSTAAFNVLTPSSKADQPDCSTLTVITESLPTFFVGEPVNFQIEPSGERLPTNSRLWAEGCLLILI